MNYKILCTYPLLHASPKQAIWIMILRFMGDRAEAKFEEDVEITQFNYHVKESKSASQSKEFQAALAALNETESKHQHLIRKTLKRKTKFPDLLRKTLDNVEKIEFYEQFLNVRSSNLEKLHFIIGHGILQPTLRLKFLYSFMINILIFLYFQR